MSPMSVRLPPSNTPSREAAILDAVANGNFVQIEWAPVRASVEGHNATFFVFSDAIKLVIDDTPVRINACAKTTQIIADILDCSMLTPKLADLIFDQANVRVAPCTMVRTTRDVSMMSTTAWMMQHSKRIDERIQAISPTLSAFTAEEVSAFPDKAGTAGLLTSTVGKHWVINQDLAKKPVDTACNYGWHFSGPAYEGNPGEIDVSRKHRLIQGPWFKHNDSHVDYSQTVQLVHKQCLVDGSVMSLLDVLSSSQLARLASHQGAMTYLRQRSVFVG